MSPSSMMISEPSMASLDPATSMVPPATSTWTPLMPSSSVVTVRSPPSMSTKPEPASSVLSDLKASPTESTVTVPSVRTR